MRALWLPLETTRAASAIVSSKCFCYHCLHKFVCLRKLAEPPCTSSLIMISMLSLELTTRFVEFENRLE